MAVNFLNRDDLSWLVTNTYKLACQSCYGDSGWLKLAGCFGEE
jgi:hypothetical protein